MVLGTCPICKKEEFLYKFNVSVNNLENCDNCNKLIKRKRNFKEENTEDYLDGFESPPINSVNIKITDLLTEEQMTDFLKWKFAKGRNGRLTQKVIVKA